jgi:hypothetical protein
VNFDAEISADGQTLYAVDGQFSARGIPRTADIFMARRHGDAFVRMEAGDRLLKLVNTEELEYAPAISSDGLENVFHARARDSRGRAASHLACGQVQPGGAVCRSQPG